MRPRPRGRLTRALAAGLATALAAPGQQVPRGPTADRPPAPAAIPGDPTAPLVLEVSAAGALTLAGAPIDVVALPDALRAQAAAGPRWTVPHGEGELALAERPVQLRVAPGVSCAVLEPLLDACAAGLTPRVLLAVGDGDAAHRLFVRAPGGGPDPLPRLRLGAGAEPLPAGRLYRALRDAAGAARALHVRADAAVTVEDLVDTFDLARRAGHEHFELTVALSDAERRAAAAGDLRRLLATVPRDREEVGRQFDGLQPAGPAADRLARALAAGRPVGGVFGGRPGGRLRMARGAHPDAAAAIGRGLEWLRAQQGADGSWADGDAFATAAALLAFLADGSTRRTGEYRDVVERGSGWLAQAVTARGSFDVGGLHAQAVATTALVEACGLSRAGDLQDGAQRALDLLLAMRDRDGVWRDGGELEAHIGAHCVLAWRVARELGLRAAPDAAAPTVAWLAALARSDEPPPGAAAAALFAAHLGGDATVARALGDEMAARIDAPRDGDLLRSLHDGAAALHQHGGTRWAAWRADCAARVVATQRSDAGLAGSWDADHGDPTPAGRVEATADACLTLAAPHRFGPLLRP